MCVGFKFWIAFRWWNESTSPPSSMWYGTPQKLEIYAQKSLPIFWNTTKSQGAEHNIVLFLYSNREFWSVFLVNFMLSMNLVFLMSVSDMAAILRITNFFHTLPLKLSRQVVVKSNYYDRYSKGEFTFSFSTRECNKKISARELFQVRTPKKSFCSVVMVKFTWLFAVISHNSVIVISYFLVYILKYDI